MARGGREGLDYLQVHSDLLTSIWSVLGMRSPEEVRAELDKISDGPTFKAVLRRWMEDEGLEGALPLWRAYLPDALEGRTRHGGEVLKLFESFILTFQPGYERWARVVNVGKLIDDYWEIGWPTAVKSAFEVLALRGSGVAFASGELIRKYSLVDKIYLQTVLEEKSCIRRWALMAQLVEGEELERTLERISTALQRYPEEGLSIYLLRVGHVELLGDGEVGGAAALGFIVPRRSEQTLCPQWQDRLKKARARALAMASRAAVRGYLGLLSEYRHSGELDKEESSITPTGGMHGPTGGA